MFKIFNEIWSDSKYPSGTLHGNAAEALEYTSSGEQSDWITGALGIPSICPEIGSSDIFSYDFTIPFKRVVLTVLKENINWMDHTYHKIGNHYELTPLGQNKGKFYLLVTNKGMSDQLTPLNLTINGKTSQFALKGLKKRSSKVVTFYPKKYDGKKAIKIEYSKFWTSDPKFKDTSVGLKFKDLTDSETEGLTQHADLIKRCADGDAVMRCDDPERARLMAN